MTAPMPASAFDTESHATPPRHDALALTDFGKKAQIVLNDMVYTLTITRAGKLILTK